MRGFGKRKLTENVVINMTNFDTPTIDAMISRFPVIAEDIFKELDNKTLIKCRKVCVLWQNFFDSQKFIWIRRMQKYSESMEQFYEQWKLVIRNTPTDHVKQLSKVVEQFFDDFLDKKKGLFDDLYEDISMRKSQWAPLHATAHQGHSELSRYIIQKTNDKNPTGFDDITPLHMAAFHGHLEVYQLIAESLEDKNPTIKNGLSSLHLSSLQEASENGNLEVCKYIMDNLLDKNPSCVQGTYLEGLTPYDIAACNGQLEICKLFLETLADKNPVTFISRTPLHHAATEGHLQVCKVILESIENKNPVSNAGNTPLHCAAARGHLEILRLLLDNGVDRRLIYNRQ